MTAAELINQIQIATPCSAEWSRMRGDDKVRFCEACRKSVYNLSAMSADEALATIREKEGTLCARLFRRHDGTVLHQDCPVGMGRVARRLAGLTKVLLLLAGVSASAWLLPNLVRRDSPLRQRLDENWTGLVSDVKSLLGWHEPPEPPLMGDVALGGCQPPPLPLTPPAVSGEG